ncbi:hypothetical protein SAMN06272735_5019 [Streptomyces sp. TLI_55]|uniref:hypothetical protein n=1 Tax=Streptomyces sp. TLI_55 TaxID=1938861 RepID=UPI000BD6B118|nr:hypothetical protein [Streptomyces sp. TLI_55]SNX63217.1 hypothetical protein SAMN06272735_5019 [Streptomyces sp. TLI_55]
MGTQDISTVGPEGGRPETGGPGLGLGFQPTPPPTRNSLKWALLLPLLAVLAGVVTQYPYGGLWIGVIFICGLAATAAILAGGVWHRAGAAVLATAAVFALSLFAGPAFYETYLKQAGEKTVGAVVDTGEKRGLKRGTVLDVCRVVATSGKVWDLSADQNCHGQFEAGQLVVVFEDPLGVLDPWVEARPGERKLDALSLGLTGGLFLVTGGVLFCAGQRRRAGR